MAVGAAACTVAGLGLIAQPAMATGSPLSVTLGSDVLALPGVIGSGSDTLDVNVASSLNTLLGAKLDLIAPNGSSSVVGGNLTLSSVLGGTSGSTALALTSSELSTPGVYQLQATDLLGGETSSPVGFTVYGPLQSATIAKGTAPTPAVPDTVPLVVSGTDTAGQLLPLSGTVTITSTADPAVVHTTFSEATGGQVHVNAALGSITTCATAVATVNSPVIGLTASSSTNSIDLGLPCSHVGSVGLTTTSPTVYPVKDGFQDSVGFSDFVGVSPSSGAVTGTATISSGGTVVKSYALSGTGQSFTWDGLVNGRVVPGTYVLTVAVRGDDGQTVTKSTTIVVSGESLVRKSVVVTQSAASALKTIARYNTKSGGSCTIGKSAVACVAGKNAPKGTAVLTITGAIAVPQVVKDHTAFQVPSVTVRTAAKSLGGSTTAWAVAGREVSKRALVKGTLTNANLPFTSTPSKVTVSEHLSDRAHFTVQSYSMTFYYTVLQ